MFGLRLLMRSGWRNWQRTAKTKHAAQEVVHSTWTGYRFNLAQEAMSVLIGLDWSADNAI